MTQLEETAIMEEQALACGGTEDRITLSDLVRNRGRLISLLDLVELMKPFDISKVFDFALRVGYFEFLGDLLDIEAKAKAGFAVPRPYELNTLPWSEIEEMCDAMGFIVSAATLRKRQDEMDRILGGMKHADAHTTDWSLHTDLTKQFRRSFEVEAKSLKLLYVQPDRVMFWNESNRDDEGNSRPCHIDKKWEDILTKLHQDARKDLIHAGTCYACSEYTAGALHLFRVYEYACKDFAARHGIALTRNSNWKVFANDLQKHIGNSNPPLCIGEITIINAVRDDVNHLAKLWRNDTCHSSGTFYDDVDALAIYHGVKNLTKKMVDL